MPKPHESLSKPHPSVHGQQSQLRRSCQHAIKAWFDATGWTQAKAAGVLGLSQPRMSALLRGVDQFSLDALVRMLTLAGLNVSLTLAPAEASVVEGRQR